MVLRLLQVDLNSLNVAALFDWSHPRHCRGYRKKPFSLDCTNIHLPSVVSKRNTSFGKFSNSSTWEISNRYCHNEYAVWNKRCYLRERLSSLAWIFLHRGLTLLELVQSFAITTAVPLLIEWFFTCLSIETRYQNRPIMAVWGSQWKIH